MIAPLHLRLLRALAPLLDGALVMGLVLGVWAALVRSPLCNPADPQWARGRYLVAAALAAAAYVLLSWCAGLYRAAVTVERARIPLINLGTCAVLLAAAWLALARYAAASDGAVLLSRRVLLLALFGSYVLTSFLHYARCGMTARCAHHCQERS